jgi:hypothetical protein
LKTAKSQRGSRCRICNGSSRSTRRSLGLEPSEERPRGLLYRCCDGEFAFFESAGAASGDHTQMAWEVEDIEVTVERLRGRGVVFEEYDLPGLRTVSGIAAVRLSCRSG